MPGLIAFVLLSPQATRPSRAPLIDGDNERLGFGRRPSAGTCTPLALGVGENEHFHG